jgi:hypothetical protein
MRDDVPIVVRHVDSRAVRFAPANRQLGTTRVVAGFNGLELTAEAIDLGTS